jgi:16S rRNA (cytosine1402-N4)-methyltransferase
MPVEGLRMVRCDRRSHPNTAMTDFHHRPVMLAEVVDLLREVPAGVYVDATLGGAGHAAAVLEAAPQLELIGFDQDPMAIAAATERLAGFVGRTRLVHARFDQIDTTLDELGVELITAALFDLGVSSPQLDRAERGFSYRNEGPLDMRMNPASPQSAADIVNGWDVPALTRLFRQHGESRFAGRIAARVVEARPITTTTQLAETVRSAIPAATRRTGGHPARRVFQALRVAVNDELAVLPGALDSVVERLAPGGRLAVLAYHSGEDRIVKERFRVAATGGCVCPPGLPCVCGARPIARLLSRGAKKPSDVETASNHRAESARLRAVEGVR